MKTIVKLLYCLTVAAVTLSLLALSAATAIPAAASDKEDAAASSLFAVRFEKTTDADSIILTAVLKQRDPDVNINSALTALCYDTSLLSITEDDITVLSGGMGFRTSVDAQKGIASVESAYLSQPLENGTELAAFRFSLLEGTDASSLNTDSIRLCEDSEYLARLSSNYADSGGLLLTDGMGAYTARSGVTAVSFDLPPAPGGQQNGGCRSSRDAAAALLIASSAAAVLLVIRTKHY